jgi:tetratricopeptide (TPR) repeat protein
VQLENALSLAGNDTEMRSLITRRLDGLKAIASLQRELEEADPFMPIDSAHFRFRIAEEFWLSAQLPDSALNYFSILTNSLQTPDSTRAKSLYSKAYILREIKKDTISADSIFREIIERYPHFEAAKASQEMLGIPVTLMTRRDSALVQFALAEQIFLENEDVFSQEAYYAYLLSALKYPDIEDLATRALFAAGWILNKRDILGDDVVDTAAVKIFIRLCTDYPESEHCEVATNMMNANEVQLFATQYTARTERTDSLVMSLEEQEEIEGTSQERRATLPDFQSWL